MREAPMSFHPEWGCLAPAPSFLRTMRTVLVATAVGATAGGGVVLTLVGHSAGQTSVAERTLVRPIPAVSTSVSAPQIARLNPEPLSQRESTKLPLEDDEVDGAAPNALSPSSPVHPAVVGSGGRETLGAYGAKAVVAPSDAPRNPQLTSPNGHNTRTWEAHRGKRSIPRRLKLPRTRLTDFSRG